MQHLRGRIAKSDVRTTYHVRTYASSTVSRHFGAETKMHNIQHNLFCTENDKSLQVGGWWVEGGGR